MVDLIADFPDLLPTYDRRQQAVTLQEIPEATPPVFSYRLSRLLRMDLNRGLRTIGDHDIDLLIAEPLS